MTSPKLPINMLLLHIIKNCNSHCSMCDCWREKKSILLDLEDIKSMIDAFEENGGKMVLVSGGEPLLHPNIQDILKYIKDKGLTASLNTNGLLIKKHADKIIPFCDFIIVSMDCLKNEQAYLLRGHTSNERILKDLEFIQKEFQTNIQLRCTISRKNLFSFYELIDYAQTVGFRVSFSPIDYSSDSFGREKEPTNTIDDWIPSNDELNKFEQLLTTELGNKIQKAFQDQVITWDIKNFNDLISYFRHCRNKNIICEKQMCFLPYTSLIVDYNGDIRPCFYLPAFTHIKNINKEALSSFQRVQQMGTPCKCEGCRGHVFT